MLGDSKLKLVSKFTHNVVNGCYSMSDENLAILESRNTLLCSIADKNKKTETLKRKLLRHRDKLPKIAQVFLHILTINFEKF